MELGTSIGKASLKVKCNLLAANVAALKRYVFRRCRDPRGPLKPSGFAV